MSVNKKGNDASQSPCIAHYLPNDASLISDRLQNRLSLGSECVFLSLFHFRDVTAVLIYVATAHYTSAVLYCWLVHPEWYSYNLLAIFLLPECRGIVIHLMNLAVEESNNWITDYLEPIIEIELKSRILNNFTPTVNLKSNPTKPAGLLDLSLASWKLSTLPWSLWLPRCTSQMETSSSGDLPALHWQ